MFFNKKTARKLVRLTSIRVFGQLVDVPDAEFPESDKTDHQILADYTWIALAFSTKVAVLYPMVLEKLELSSPQDVAAEVTVNHRFETRLSAQELLTAKENFENVLLPQLERIDDKLTVIGPAATIEDAARLTRDEILSMIKELRREINLHRP